MVYCRELTPANLLFTMVITFQKVKLIHIGKIQLFLRYSKIQFSGETEKSVRLWSKLDIVFSKTLEVPIMDLQAWNGVCQVILLKDMPRFREV